jgi:hypothetical protein
MAALENGAHAAAQRFGFDVDPIDARLGRLDIAAELTFDDGRDGLAFLHALSLADVPWAKVGTEGKKREHIQTVNFRTVRGRQILMRAYDKGIEAGIAPPGELIRFERQRRYRKTAERTVAQALELDPCVRSSWGASSRASSTLRRKRYATRGGRSTDSTSSCVSIDSGRRGRMRSPGSLFGRAKGINLRPGTADGRVFERSGLSSTRWRANAPRWP